MITKELLQKTNDAPSEERRYLCERSFELFLLYYFEEYVQYAFAPFHYEMFEDLRDLQGGSINELLWIVFREGAKTSISKIFLTYIICYEKRYYINVDSFDKGNAEAVLFDVVLSLQTNQKIINDFGNLYNTRRSPEEAQKKRITDFITTTGTRVEAHSTQESVRGRLYKNHRPDFFYIEDFETNKTADSEAYTAQVLRHFSELTGGLGPNSWVLYSCNYISDHGSVQSLIERAKGDKRFRVRNVPIMRDGKLTWPAKYALTDEEAQRTGKVSIAEKRRKLKGDFEKEMMNDPSKAEDAFFTRSIAEEKMRNAREPIEAKGHARYYFKYNPSHRYALAGDPSMGVGRDSNASAMIDFTSIPARVVLCYDDNQITPDVFAYELRRQGNEYGTCLIAPECNSESGGTCVNQLRNIYDIDRIYRRIPAERLVDKISAKIGWETNAATKPEIMFQFKSAFEDGLIDVFDMKLLEEIRNYSQVDLQNTPGTTRHFDLLMAAAIAWAMRNYAVFESTGNSDYRQPDYEPPTLAAGVSPDTASRGQQQEADVSGELKPHRRS